MRRLARSQGTRLARSLALACAVALATAASAGAAVRTYYVRAGARPGGDGTRHAPFASLAAVQRATGPGARIVIESAPGALDGGITLKAGQSLVGQGRSARIENTDAGSQDGDAVRLASRTTVRNLVIGPAVRGGIYGLDVTAVRILGNDLRDANTGCSTGFVVAPFELPTLVAGVGAPFSSGLSNGWASVMIDASRGTQRVWILHNWIHDATCADGIDVRAMGTSHVSASVRGNRVTRLQEAPSKESVLAIGMQTLGTATLRAQVIGNTETYIGSQVLDGQGDADSEGLFANSAGHSLLIEHAAHNTFAHGLGHLSANCFEAAASSGGPTMVITFDHSTCDTVPGDLLEADNLSAGSTMDFTVDHVLAERSNWLGAPVMEQAEPGDDGDCMLVVASGARSTTSVRILHSVLQDCAADGVGVLSNVVTGTGPVRALRFEIDESRIADVSGNAVRVGWATPVSELDGVVQRSALVDSGGAALLVESLETSGTTHPRIDLGGGPLGSVGENCISAGLDAELLRASASAAHDWWGRPGGPAPGRVLAVGGSLDDAAPLSGPPPGGC